MENIIHNSMGILPCKIPTRDIELISIIIWFQQLVLTGLYESLRFPDLNI